MKAKRTPERGRAAREVVEELDDGDDVDYAPPRDRRRGRRRGRPWGKLLILLVILIGVVAALPTIVAKTPLRNALLAYALPANTLRITVADASLGWFSTPAIAGIEIRDSQRQQLATIESLRMNRSPLALASNWNELGEVEIERPVVYLAVRPDGTNWLDALKPLLKESESAATDGDQSKSKPLPAIGVRVIDGTVLVEETATAQRWRLYALNAQLDTHGTTVGIPPASVSGQLDAGGQGNVPTTAAAFAIALTNDAGRQQATLQLQNIPLAAAEPWLRLEVPGATLSGGLFGQGAATWAATAANPLADCATNGMLTIQSLDFSAPQLVGDRVRLATVEVPWRLTSQANGITIEDLQLKTAIARLAARGTLDPAMFATAAASESMTLNPAARHDVEFQGEVELAPLAAMLPHLLRIRSDTSITAGKLQLAGRSEPIEGGQAVSGQLRTSGIAATSAGRPITWDAPIDATFEVRREAGQLRLESLKCASEFLSVAAAGTVDQLTANANFDLNRLSAQLGQFVDLRSTELAGTGTAHVDWHHSGGQFKLLANSDVSQLRVGLGDGKAYAEPRLALKAEANGELDSTTHEPRRVAAARLQVEAEGDQLDAQLTGPVDWTAGDASWPFTMRLTGEISRWMARLRPWYAPDPWQASGQSELAADVRAAPQAVEVTNAKLSITNLHVVGVGWNITEPRVEMVGDLNWNGVTGEVASQSSQLVSSSVTMAAKDVRLEAGGAGPPRANGVAAFRADLARIASWRATAGQPLQFQPQGKVSGNLRFDQQADRITSELTATGEQVTLQQLTSASNVRQAGYQTIWQEPQVNVRGTTTYEPAADRLAFRQFQVQSSTLALMADGQVDRLSTTADVNANGALSYDLALVTPLLKPWVGDGIQLVGKETARFQAAGSLAPSQPGAHWSRTLEARGELPWQSANVYGLPIGPGKLAATLGGGLVRADPLAIAVAEGQLTTAPQVRLDPSPLELTLPPGPVLTNVRISPQVSEAMLKYIAPVLAGATQSAGQFSLTLADAKVPLGDTRKADVAGQLAVHAVRVVPGPMARQWVELAQQIEAIAKKRDLASLAGRQPVTLLSVQDQQVNFRVVDGRVYHQGMQFQVGDVVMQTEGSVGFDQTVALVVHVPIQDKWIEGQALLVGLKGQSLKIPISGTLAQPRMDQSAVAGLSQQLLQGAAQQAIGGELNKALDKLFKTR